jgi:predicted RNA-binding Zn-ribbon protein involved in translation (DUF1610 family)
LIWLLKIFLSLLAILIVISVGIPLAARTWFTAGPRTLLGLGAMEALIIGTLALLILFVGLSIALFVYFDAKQRGMEPLLWALVAALVPYLLGLVSYLVFRQPIQGICPSCNQQFAATDVFCGHCGHAVQSQCQSCRRPLSAGARFCPSCGTPRSEAVGPQFS